MRSFDGFTGRYYFNVGVFESNFVIVLVRQVKGYCEIFVTNQIMGSWYRSNMFVYYHNQGSQQCFSYLFINETYLNECIVQNHIHSCLPCWMRIRANFFYFYFMQFNNSIFYKSLTIKCYTQHSIDLLSFATNTCLIGIRRSCFLFTFFYYVPYS